MHDPEDPVGYKRPPRQHQFQKGQSGNPQGRPKGHRNFLTDMQDELQERIRVTEGPHVHILTKQRAVIKRMMELALKGNLRAVEVLMKWVQGTLAGEEPEHEPSDFSETDRVILERMLEQMREASTATRLEGGVS